LPLVDEQDPSSGSGLAAAAAAKNKNKAGKDKNSERMPDQSGHMLFMKHTIIAINK
jgi:hypothetical protein